MWIRKDLKTQAKLSIKKNYWCTIAVCFLMAIVVGKYAMSTTLIHQYDETAPQTDSVVISQKAASNTSIVNDFLHEASVELTGKDFFGITADKQGFLGTTFDNVTQSGSFLFGLLNSANQFFFKDKIGGGIVILIGVLISIFITMFVSNILRIGECRFFLENRIYHKTGIGRMLFLYRIKKIWNPAKIMILRTIYSFLWFLTIVGGFIKIYSYRQVPFILAENPVISRKEAFLLSRKMMDGYKWKTFILDISFFGWYVLQTVTIGLVGLFFVNPYVTSTNAELYMALRKEAIDKKYDFYQSLNDPYLAAPPSGEVVQDQSVDVVEGRA